MEAPTSLAARLYLLSYDPRRPRFAGPGGNLALILRAAALTELYLSGRVIDEDGRPRAAARTPGYAGPSGDGDAVLEDFLRQLAEAPPRPWRRWVSRGGGGIVTAVRDQLAAGGWVRVEPRRLLGVLPGHVVTVRDAPMVQRLTDDTARLIRGSGALHDVDPRDAAVAALAAVGQIRTVAGFRDRRRHRRRIAALAERGGPAIPALRRAVQERQAAATGGG